ncbi:MAG: DedA family protein [Thermoplasmataceae archaeon]|jgi:membrane protein DedA with SNARE-associated domain|nr:DedA family protein [Candidatus Thermoplasmatota archaeon]MCL5439719.1 DedA family protein [Candidatus Thermoplasmatota archaeon]
MSIVAYVITLITSTILKIQYPGIFVLMMLEGMLLPIPSEVVMVFGGYLLYENELPPYSFAPAFAILLIVGTVGNLVGALLAYLIGDKGGAEFVKLYGKKIGISEKTIDRVNLWFNKYGEVSVFVTRLVPIFRTFISIPAGLGRMKISKFISFTVIGMVIWDTILIYIGYTLGTRWNSILGISNNLTYAALAAAAIVLVVIYYMAKKSARNSTTAS